MYLHAEISCQAQLALYLLLRRSSLKLERNLQPNCSQDGRTICYDESMFQTMTKTCGGVRKTMLKPEGKGGGVMARDWGREAGSWSLTGEGRRVMASDWGREAGSWSVTGEGRRGHGQ